MLKSKKTILGVILCAVMTVCLAIGIFTGISTSKTAYASGGEISTIADVLATNTKSPTSYQMAWDNENGKSVAYVSATGKLFFQEKTNPTSVINNLSTDTSVTQNANNYEVTIEGRTITFEMDSNVLVSITVSSSKSDYLNGKYTAPHIHGEGTDAIKFTSWTSNNSLPTTAGSYVLTSDITLSSTWTVPEGVTNLCLNGYVIQASGESISAITVGESATFNLYNCKNTTHNGYVDANGLWHLDESSLHVLGYNEERFLIDGGIITGGDLCGVVVNQNGTFNMYSGNIVGNTSSSGGGVSNNGTFNLYDGSICYNVATADGGGVSNGGTFNLYDGCICYNYSTGSGGGVNNSTGTFTMTGGIVTENTAINGGGLYSDLDIAINILTGGTITDNTAQYGGGVYYMAAECFAAGTLITMEDGTQKPIETLSKGESVRVFDHESGTVSSSKLFDVWSYPEKHSNIVELLFSHNVKVTVVYGHSFFEKEQNKYVAVTRDNVSAFVGHEFYNVDSNCWETLEGYEFINGEVDTYVITTEYHLNCVANGMLSNEDGFYTLLTNIFEYGDNLKIDQVKKAQDIANFGLYGYENIKHMSKYAYDVLNAQYMKVAFGKGMISESEFNYLEAYYASLDPELYCSDKQNEEIQSKKALMKAPLMSPLTSTPVSAPTTPGIYLGGSIKIINNTSGNLYLSGGKLITIGTGTGEGGNGVAVPTEEMNVGITLQNGTGDFATGVLTDDYLACFTSDNEIYSVKAKKETTYTYSIVHEHEEESIYFDTAWTNNNSLPTTAGNYFLTCDITLSETWTVPAGTDADNIAVTNLCLNGYVIKFTGETGSVINILQYATLNLYDCGTTSHNGYVDSNGLWHLDANEEHSILEGETEKDIIGGVITGGNTYAGGGVYVNNGSSFTMHGGSITGNTASVSGGGVYIYDGSFTMTGGSIIGNTTGSCGGGVNIYMGSFTMNGGSISGNAAGEYGGGVYVNTDATFNMTGNSVISNNKGGQGAGVYSIGTFSMSENSKITGNTGSTGGGVNVYGGTFTMSGGSIDNNTGTLGGGVAVSGTSATFKMLGGSIINNKAIGEKNVYAGGVIVNGSITLGGSAQITGNTLNGATNNVYLPNGKTITLGTDENAPTTMKVGITLANKVGQFTTAGITGDYSSNFFSDSEKYAVCFNAGTEAPNDEYLELKNKVVFDEEYIWNNGTEIIYGNDYSELPPKVYFNGEEVTGLTLTYTYYKATDGSSWTKLNKKADDAGSYKVEIAVSGSDTYTGSKEFSFTIGKAEQVITITDPSKVYDRDFVYVNYNYLGDVSYANRKIEFKVYGESDDKYTENSPKYGGTYVVRVSLPECTNYLAGSATKEFTISKATINTVGFADVTAPEGGKTAETTVTGLAMDAKYTGTVTWSPSLVKGSFDYNTEYTATITLTITGDNNIKCYKFAEDVSFRLKGKASGVTNGWEISEDSTEDALILTKTFEKTGKEPQTVEITNDISRAYNGEAISAPTYTKLGDGTVTIEYKLATEDDDKYTTTAPINAGSYVVRVSVAETETHLSGFTTKEFTIAKAQAVIDIANIETIYSYNGNEQVVNTGATLNHSETTLTYSDNKFTNAGTYTIKISAIETANYLSVEKTVKITVNKIDYDMSGVSFTDKKVRITDSDEDKKLAISGTLPTGLDGVQLSVSYVDNDNTERGVYTVTAKFSTTSINYNTPSDMTAVLTILWVRDSEKESGSDNEFVIVTSETGIDPTLTLKVDVVKIDNSDSQYKEVADSIKNESSFNAYLDKIFGVYDVSLIDQNNVKVQPDGTIKVYMTIPEEIKNCVFRIYHIHNGVASKADYVIDNGYAVIETDELSEFVFVYEQTSLLPWIIVLSIISALGIAGIVLLLLKNKKDKQGRE